MARTVTASKRRSHTPNPEEELGIIDQVKNLLRTRKSSYVQTFEGVGASRAVLKDLARFCYANKTAFHADPRAHAVAEGRREVWLRIQQHLNLSSDELFNLTQEGK